MSICEHEATGDFAQERIPNTRRSGEWTAPFGYQVGPYVHSTKYEYRPGLYTPGEDGTFAQNYQDVWFETLARHNDWLEQPGFYLDLGAFHPWQCSNTALLDVKYNWAGICVEPRHKISFANRSCVLVNRPMSGPESNELVRMGGNGDEGSQLFGINHVGTHQIYEMRTLNAVDLLNCVDLGRRKVAQMTQPTRLNCEGVRGHVRVPNFIHLVSMDIEGAEYQLLQSWPWDQLKVAVFIIENQGGSRNHQQIRHLMMKQGYLLTHTENPGVDEFWVLPEYWHDSLAIKEWRYHPGGSFGC